MAKLTLDKVDVKGKRVLMRVDFNVPQHSDGAVRDDTRIRAALKSINFVREHGGKLILMSHLGRPKLEPGDTIEAARRRNKTMAMDTVADRLWDLAGAKVTKLDDLAGPEVEKAVNAMKEGGIILLENTRFHPGETKNDPELSRQLAELGDVYVNDAFGSMHRAHASTEGCARHFDQRAAGFLVADEVKWFERILHDPKRPLVAILGGAKVSDKIPVIENLLNLVDTLIIGGGMAYTFMKAQGNEIGNSLIDLAGLKTTKQIMAMTQEKGVTLLLPIDTVVAEEFSPDAERKIAGLGEIETGWQGLDIGPKTVALFTEAIAKAGTVVWNGPLGVFEMEPFSHGTHAIAEVLAGGSMISVIGGGDTAAAITQFGLVDKMSHVSTGGGASLEMLEGKTLPGIAVLTDA